MADLERNNSSPAVALDQKNGSKSASAEPTEADPCIDAPPGSRFLGRAEHLVRQRTGLTREGVRYAAALLLAALVLLAVVLALAIAWPTWPHHLRFPLCARPACLRAAAQLQEGLNSSVSPCEDPWTWACGRWLASNSLPHDKATWDQKKQLVRKEAALVRDLITTLPLPLHTQTLEWKLMYFYESCMDVDTIEIDKHSPLMNMISELGGWKILKNWNMADHDGMSLFINLHTNYGVSPYFTITVDPNPNVPGGSLIRISPSGLGLPDRSYYFNREDDDAMERAYIQFISDVVINLGAIKEDADKFGKDLFNYEKRIAEITPETWELQDPIQTNNIRTLHELSQTLPTLYIHDILSKMNPETNIDDTVEVIVTSTKYLEEVASISSSTDKATANSYLMWTLVREYLPYLNHKFSASWNSYNTAVFGIKSLPERWEFCTDLTQRFMGLAIETLLEKYNPITNTTKRTITHVYKSLKDTVGDRLTQFAGTPNLYRHLTYKLSGLELQIGLPEEVTMDYVKNYYKKLNVIKKSFFNNCKWAIRFLRSMEERRLSSSHPEDYVLTYAFSKASVSYSPSVNKVIVPRILLSDFYYEDQHPWPVIFGRLGVEISEAIISSVLPYQNVWTSDLRLLTQFHIAVNESINEIEQSKHCVKNFMLDKNLADQQTATLTALNVVKTISSVDVTEQTLTCMLKMREEHVHQPSFESFEDSALFFLSYSQTLCSITARQFELYEITTKFRSPRKQLLYVIWSQVPGFKESFDCPTDSRTRCDDIF